MDELENLGSAPLERRVEVLEDMLATLILHIDTDLDGLGERMLTSLDRYRDALLTAGNSVSDEQADAAADLKRRVVDFLGRE